MDLYLSRSNCELSPDADRPGEEHTEDMEGYWSRSDPKRKSKESGYESAVTSPVSPLRGPDSVENLYDNELHDIVPTISRATTISSLDFNFEANQQYMPRGSNV